ncbi:hypothetical protein ACJIZ3_004008 [Penstemon smallii]|uniref:NOT2/NOT3/NOT5 C-terminal domain-containing protein n=1 Tax=Penstemon smallii TaxID=265156 RepID=A0ABD3S0V4_9LAMI
MNGSNSNLPDGSGRAFATSFNAQSGSSGAVLNQSGNIQGLHNINGGFNMSNIPGQYASRNSANIPNNVQQAPGSVSNGRYAMNSPGVLPNMGNTGRITNPIGGLVGGGNTSRGSNSNVVANIPGLSSRLNMNGKLLINLGFLRLLAANFETPQMVNMLGNSYSGGGVPLNQNQYQPGNNNNNFSFMALLNEANAIDDSSFDLSEFPQLSGGHPHSHSHSHSHSAGGSQGQLGLMQNHNIGFNQQNQEFSIQNEDFPALPGYKGGINVGGSAEYAVNAHQKEHLHDSMTNLMQSQQLSMGRSSGYNYGGSYSSHHPQQQQLQHHASSINGNGVSYLTSGNPDLHFIKQYQQLVQAHSRFTNPFRDTEMTSTQGPQLLSDQYGMLGLLNIIKVVNPATTSLALGLDLTTLGMNLNSPETLHNKLSSPWSDEPVKVEPVFSVPDCYYAKQPPPLKQSSFARFRPETLLYIFYSMPKDEAQLFAANELCNRGWFYHKELRLWFTRVKNMEPLVKTNTYERGYYYCFDPNTWQTTRKDNFVLQYEMVEKRPILPQQ